LPIKHLRYNQIDLEKWDNCISKSLNNFVFGYSWYLDIVTEAWEALVENDYERVMPLPFDYKLNYQFIYQPMFAPQLGIFSTTPLNSDDIINFIDNIPQKFKKIEINLNKFNILDKPTLQLTKKTLFSIDLIESYEKISNKYSYQIKENLESVKSQKYFISNGIAPNEIITFLRKNNFTQNENNYDTIRKIISYTLNRKFSKLYCVYDFRGNLVCITFFIISNYNVNLLIFAITNDENKSQIISLIIDSFINEHAEKSLTFNIEPGTFAELPEILRGFGAQEYFYQTININRIPRIFRFFIRKKLS